MNVDYIHSLSWSKYKQNFNVFKSSGEKMSSIKKKKSKYIKNALEILLAIPLCTTREH